MRDPRQLIGWSCVAALCVASGMGCSNVGDDDASKLKAELNSMRAELSKAQAESAALRAELEKLKADVRAQPGVAADQERAALPGRLAATKALTSFSQKQGALAKLAVDAAELGDAETMRTCIDQLTSFSQKQEVIYKSAFRLARANKMEDAIALVNTLRSASQRQGALSKIANGDYQD